MDRHERRSTHAYVVGVSLRNDLRDGNSLCAAIESIDGPFQTLEDGYPDWHPGPRPFEGILKLFYYREITGQIYRGLAEFPELADVFGLDRIPRASVLSRAWRDRFDDNVHEFIEPGAETVSSPQLRKMDLMRAFCLLRSNKIRHKLPTNSDIRFSNTRQFRSNSVSLRVPVSHYPERAYP
jgi:hypothetical protein